MLDCRAGWAEVFERRGSVLNSSRPEVVQKIRLLAFDAVRSDLLPKDITYQEQAEGLISFAMSLLRYNTDTQAALEEGRRLVQKYTDAPVGSYFG